MTWTGERTTRLRSFALYILPIVAWAGLIFWLSHKPASDYEGIGGAAGSLPLASELVHGFEYLVLAALLVRWLAFRFGRINLHRARLAFIALTLAVAYGATDEIHQGFVAGRSPSALDLVANAGGAATAVLAWFTWPLVRRESNSGTAGLTPAADGPTSASAAQPDRGETLLGAEDKTP